MNAPDQRITRGTSRFGFFISPPAELISSNPNVEYRRAGRYASVSFQRGTALASENSLAGDRPRRKTDSPSRPSVRKMSALTRAPRLGTHLEISRRTTPIRTVIQVIAIAIPASTHVECVLRKPVSVPTRFEEPGTRRNIWVNVPAKIR